MKHAAKIVALIDGFHNTRIIIIDILKVEIFQDYIIHAIVFIIHLINLINSKFYTIHSAKIIRFNNNENNGYH